MYTCGIRHIFTSKSAASLIEAKLQACDSGYEALNFNGDIYIKTEKEKNKWVKSCFRVIDFTFGV
jgi:hypothetical protein